MVSFFLLFIVIVSISAHLMTWWRLWPGATWYEVKKIHYLYMLQEIVRNVVSNENVLFQSWVEMSRFRVTTRNKLLIWCNNSGFLPLRCWSTTVATALSSPYTKQKKNRDVSVNALGKFAGSRFLSEVPRVAVIMGVSNHNYILTSTIFYQSGWTPNDQTQLC